MYDKYSRGTYRDSIQRFLNQMSFSNICFAVTEAKTRLYITYDILKDGCNLSLLVSMCNVIYI